MVLMFLALIPSIVLLIYIYKKDRKEKEPVKLLLGCFFMGVLTIFPAVILEVVEEVVIKLFCSEGTVIWAVLEGFVVAALSEELFKYLFLKARTWKSRYFDCMFDGIIYSVFVSMGFATLENVLYVFQNGIGTAVLRMVTAVPGHACFAVFMGYYYSKAKLAQVRGDKQGYSRNKRLALWVPVLLHGVYDCLLMMEGEVVGFAIVGLAALTWIAYVIVLFCITFCLVRRASRNDQYILYVPGGNIMLYNVAYLGFWQCSCGRNNNGNYCTGCGQARPIVGRWRCSTCGQDAYWNFCAYCGTKQIV